MGERNDRKEEAEQNRAVNKGLGNDKKDNEEENEKMIRKKTVKENNKIYRE